MVDAPTFTAEKGEFKKRAQNIPKEVDFFGKGWSAAMTQLLQAVDAIGGDAEAVFRNMAGRLFADFQFRTPVDIGTARAGWRFLPGTAGGNDVEIVIVNGVEYIVYLEFGWSKQAPRGMVRIALANMVKRIPLKMKGIVR